MDRRLGFVGRGLIWARDQARQIGVFPGRVRTDLGLLVLPGHLLRGFLFLVLLPLHLLAALLKRGFRVSPHASSPLSERFTNSHRSAGRTSPAATAGSPRRLERSARLVPAAPVLGPKRLPAVGQ